MTRNPTHLDTCSVPLSAAIHSPIRRLSPPDPAPPTSRHARSPRLALPFYSSFFFARFAPLLVTRMDRSLSPTASLLDHNDGEPAKKRQKRKARPKVSCIPCQRRKTKCEETEGACAQCESESLRQRRIL